MLTFPKLHYRSDPIQHDHWQGPPQRVSLLHGHGMVWRLSRDVWRKQLQRSRTPPLLLGTCGSSIVPGCKSDSIAFDGFARSVADVDLGYLSSRMLAHCK